MMAWGGTTDHKDDPTTLIWGYPGFDNCKLRITGAGHGVFVPGTHGHIQK